ncbi:MAG: hypothetical protein AVDCRST_MAG03-1465 [uncultured Rubrobacteraceae bacterium]|uniref:Uncharacterized protein n=1 Tax=uncultured Rubrobacteraceae bacterium TaxID=349277 RepID=A0A6J4P2Y0_9ACTN|nr:MAG: hypothetical protein AVDCRST_MAG03-1465 [uncultured Rubrobacteraceae bacterium]
MPVWDFWTLIVTGSIFGEQVNGLLGVSETPIRAVISVAHLKFGRART